MAVFIFIAVLFAVGVIVTVTLVSPKKEMVITSEIVISKPSDVVWSYIRLLRNQVQYNTWILSDPNIKMEYSGTDGMPGFIAAWQSKTRMGSGEQEILKVTEGHSMETELRFANHENTTHVLTKVEAAGNDQTKVTTVMTANPVGPMRLMMPVMKGMIKKGSDDMLKNLKKTLDK
jgi:uncharacterized protein YndB with AHSA1/START domain